MVEHPDGQFQQSAGRLIHWAAAENIPADLLYHLIDANDSPEPRMPAIDNLEFVNPVGVLSPYCTTR
jgi:hypothetical protein